MSRIWQEGFEDGIPHSGYIEGTPNGSQSTNFNTSTFPTCSKLVSGRNIFSKKALLMAGGYAGSGVGARIFFSKIFVVGISEFYYRAYVKLDRPSDNRFPPYQFLRILNASGTVISQLSCSDLVGTCSFIVNINGTLTTITGFSLPFGSWHKADIYLKIGVSGAYEMRLNNNTIAASSNSIVSGTSATQFQFTCIGQSPTTYADLRLTVDDLAINDKTGDINNSWCGDGSIISLKPKGVGNKSQWTTSEGYAKAESGTTTTNLKITNHGLSNNDVIFNKTRNTYRLCTVVDPDNVTVSTITGQTTNDIILMYAYVNTIASTAGATDYVRLPGVTIKSGDVFVNTSRSNAIRKVQYMSSDYLYNYKEFKGDGTYGETLEIVGSTVTSQTTGDSINTFSFKPYAISNHWEAVTNQQDPSPKLSYIQTSTPNHIDTFDMEELVADKGLPAGSVIVAVSHSMYAQELGSGSQIKPVFRINNTDYEGDTITLNGGTSQYQKLYEKSPATSSAWTRAEIDALEAGVKLL